MFSAMLPLLYASVAAAGMAVRRRSLKMVGIYLGFMVIAGIMGTVLSLTGSPKVYWFAFWLVELTHNCLLCLMALEIICRLVPRRFVLMWASAFLFILAMAFARTIPSSHTAELLNLSLSAAFVAGILLIALAFAREIDWTPEHTMSAIGTAAVIVGQAIPSIRWIHGEATNLAIQIGPLAGLILLACSRAKEPTRRWICSANSANAASH